MLKELSLQKKKSTVDLEDLLEIICVKNYNILNMIIKDKFSLLQTSLKFIFEQKSSVINFENKR